jgi:acyl carrier protein
VEETFDISIPDRDAATLITPALLISYVQQAVSSKPVQGPCLSQRAFHRVRSNLCEVTEFSRRDIRLGTRIDHLFPKSDRQQRWDTFAVVTGLRSLPKLRLGRGSLFAPKLVGDIVSFEIGAMSEANRMTGDWTDQEVRSVVRTIICEQLGIKRFHDTDEFVRDLGAD